MTGSDLVPYQQRELVVCYTTDPDILETRVSGFTRNDPLCDMFWYTVGQESDAWLLNIMGLLPDWWQMVDSIGTRGLDGVPDLHDIPLADAQSRWDDMTQAERRRLRYGWRVMRTGSGGRIHRRQDPSFVIEDFEFQAILDEMPVKALGPATPYPRL